MGNTLTNDERATAERELGAEAPKLGRDPDSICGHWHDTAVEERAYRRRAEAALAKVEQALADRLVLNEEEDRFLWEEQHDLCKQRDEARAALAEAQRINTHGTLPHGETFDCHWHERCVERDAALAASEARREELEAAICEHLYFIDDHGTGDAIYRLVHAGTEAARLRQQVETLTAERDSARRRACLGPHGETSVAHATALAWYGKLWADEHFPPASGSTGDDR